jgi:hypothetical protein
MTKPEKDPNLIQAILKLSRQGDVRHQEAPDSPLPPDLAVLRAWQAERLARTYADLLADPDTRPACLFFLSDIYGPRDFSQRDHDVERLYLLLRRVLPDQMLATLASSIEMNRLSHQLDQQLLDVLVNQLGASGQVTAELYAEAYRRCDNEPERRTQIEVISRVLYEVHEGTHWRPAGAVLKLAYAPAAAAGWLELYDFLRRGYAAFRNLRLINRFAGTIQHRETLIMERIFAGLPEPFEIENSSEGENGSSTKG